MLSSLVRDHFQFWERVKGGRKEAVEATCDLPGDKCESRRGLLRGWMRCAIMRMFNVGVFGVSAPWTAAERETRRGGDPITVTCTHRSVQEAGDVFVFQTIVLPSIVEGIDSYKAESWLSESLISRLRAAAAASRLLMSQQHGETRISLPHTCQPEGGKKNPSQKQHHC